jgi:pyruvate dehydrogenase (quinone)
LNQVTWEQRVLSGDPKFPGSQAIPDVPYAKYADLLGFKGIFCDSPDRVGPSWDEAFLTKDRPVVLDMKVDPNTPPLPPHIRLEMARKMSSALLSDDPERWEVIKRVF